MKSIVLASKSPRRKSLLKQIGLTFTVVPSLVEERFNPRLKPRGQAEALSLQKAEAVAEGLRKKNLHSIVISADTIVVLGDEVLGKPKGMKDAKRMLRLLSGKRHSVITGFTIVDVASGKSVTKSVETDVYFKHLSEREIKEFLSLEKVSDKAGAYAIQGVGAVMIEKIDGDYFNVVGLPLHALAIELRRFGVEIL